MSQSAYATGPDKCQYCGLTHGAKCPTVKAYEYHANGTLKRVEFFGPGDYAPPVIYGPNGTYPGWPYVPPQIT